MIKNFVFLQIGLGIISFLLSENITNKTTARNVVDFISYLQFAVYFFMSKMSANGQYTPECGFDFEELLTLPRLPFKVDAVAPDFNESWRTRSDTTSRDVKVPSSVFGPVRRHRIVTFSCYLGFFLLVAIALVYLYQLIMWFRSSSSTSSERTRRRSKRVENSKTKKLATELNTISVRS